MLLTTASTCKGVATPSSEPSRQMARVGAKMLIERIHTPGGPARRVDFPCDLIVRGNTRASGSA